MKIVFRCLPELEGIIPRPFPAKKGLPEWLKKMPMTVFSEDWEKKMPTVKQCPPFVDVMSYGFMIPLPCDIRVDKGKFEWDWDGMPLSVSGRHTPRSPLGVHPMDQATGTPIYDKDSIVIKFMTQWAIELEPGYSLLATHPFNRPDLPFLSLTGLVDSDLYADNYLNFPALWTDKDFSGVLEKGTPVAQCIPIERAEYEYAFEALEGEAMERFLGIQRDLKDVDSPYKKQWRAKKT